VQRGVLVARYRRVRYPTLALALLVLFLVIGLLPKGDEGASFPVRLIVTAVLLLLVGTFSWWELFQQDVRAYPTSLEIRPATRRLEPSQDHQIAWREIEGFSVIQSSRWPRRRRYLVVHRRVGPVVEHRKIDRIDAWSYRGRSWTDVLAAALEEHRRGLAAQRSGDA